MTIRDLVEQSRTSPITDEDRISHTEKMVERVFGLPAGQLGTVELIDGRGVLVVEHDGKRRELRWSRSPRAHILWHIDDRANPLRLTDGATPLASLLDELDS